MTFLLYILVGKLDPKVVQLQELSTYRELQDEIYDTSLRLSNRISRGKSIGASNYAVMVEGISLPLVHFSQECNYSETHGGNIMNDDNTALHIAIHRTLYKDSLSHFFSAHEESSELPIDYGVIFAGLPYRFSDISAARQQVTLEEE
jgi:hypothetical protein